MYDIAVVGCGIAGASVAYQAKLKDLKVVLIEKRDPLSNASLAAGAFLSPKFGPKSPYNDFIDRAFLYSIEFYRKYFSEFLNECGMLRLPRCKEENIKCDSYSKHSCFWIKNGDGYWCESASTVSPLGVIKKMVSSVELYQNSEVKEFIYQDGFWDIDGVQAKNLVLATGYNQLLSEPYLHIKPIFGQKLEAKAENGSDFTIHRKCSVSPIKNGKVDIGASHIPSWRYEESEKLFMEHREKLLVEAKELLGCDIELLSETGGFRSATMDFFPYCGQVINSKETLLKIPSLVHGVRVSEKEFIYYPNLWIHQGHGARGFVLSPYTAKHLLKQILKEDSSENSIRVARAFLRYARKAKF